MKLNKEEINQKRSIIKNGLRCYSGPRINIKKELLEQLLFDDEEIAISRGKVIKLPVWSGAFLEHIDLSEVSFQDVYWKKKINPFTMLIQMQTLILN